MSMFGGDWWKSWWVDCKTEWRWYSESEGQSLNVWCWHPQIWGTALALDLISLQNTLCGVQMCCRIHKYAAGYTNVLQDNDGGNQQEPAARSSWGSVCHHHWFVQAWRRCWRTCVCVAAPSAPGFFAGNRQKKKARKNKWFAIEAAMWKISSQQCPTNYTIGTLCLHLTISLSHTPSLWYTPSPSHPHPNTRSLTLSSHFMHFLFITHTQTHT